MGRLPVTLLTAVVTLTASHGVAQAQSLQGTWELLEMTSPDGTVEADPHGVVVFGEHQITILHIRSKRDPFALAPGAVPTSDAEKLAFADHVAPFVVAGAGTYTVSGRTLTLHITTGLTALESPLEATFEFAFEGNDTLTTASTINASRFRYRRLE